MVKEVTRVCKYCGKKFVVSAARAKQGRGIFCSKDCQYTYMAEYLKGEKSPGWRGGQVKRICKQCGKVFFISPGRLKRKNRGVFCSKVCMYEFMKQSGLKRGKNSPTWKGGKVKKVCEYCGDVFEVVLARVESARFCSIECKGKWQSENVKGVNHKLWQRVEKECKYCENKFWVKKDVLGKGHGEFCSRECAVKWDSENRRGENNKLWRSVKRICQCCGKIFWAARYRVEDGHGNFCSYSCARKAQKIPRHHTSLEYLFGSFAKKFNIDAEYTGDSKLWIGKKGEKQLNPDFIIKINGKRYAIEIFGDYWHSSLLNPKLRESALLPYREKFYKTHGWHPIFIWGTDLLRKDAEAFVLNLLRKEGVITENEKSGGVWGERRVVQPALYSFSYHIPLPSRL